MMILGKIEVKIICSNSLNIKAKYGDELLEHQEFKLEQHRKFDRSLANVEYRKKSKSVLGYSLDGAIPGL